MEHFYENIPGWFSFERLYKSQVERIIGNGHFVELGAWNGRSTAFMAVEIINSEKNIKFDVIDVWADENNTIEIFSKNLRPVIKYINPVRGNSMELYKNYQDLSLDFVYIDTGHTEVQTFSEISLWYPKVKIGGVIAGHDFDNTDYPGVKIAVEKYFGKNYEFSKDNRSFVHTKKSKTV